jgi:hypothetical protein
MPDAEPFGHELIFRWSVVNEHHVSVTASADVERLTCSDRNHIHSNAGLCCELRQ